MSTRIHRLSCRSGAALLAILGLVLLWRVFGHGAVYLRWPACGVLLAAGLAAWAGQQQGTRFQLWVSACSFLFINTFFLLGLVEVAFRLAGTDFNQLLGKRARNDAFPIYFRLPTKPSGEVFFTRQGPDQWTGYPLRTLLKNHRSAEEAYEEEKEVTITYDSQGFRNPPDLKDWEIVIVGDSFTESGYLPEAEIFTGVLAKKMGKAVKNLGVTDTGNFSHAHYLRQFGKAPATRAAVLAFFEGNDLEDNVREMKALETFRQTGKRPSHEIPHEPSFIRSVYHLVRDLDQLRLKPRSYVNASFQTKEGREIPLTIADAPPAKAGMSAEAKAALEIALDEWKKACAEAGVEPHFLYLPCKRRVLHGLLRKGADYPQPDWEPGDLREHLQEACERRGLLFHDATPPLAQAAERGVLTFNTIYDTHFNAEGHRIVGEYLAEELKKR